MRLLSPHTVHFTNLSLTCQSPMLDPLPLDLSIILLQHYFNSNLHVYCAQHYCTIGLNITC